MNPIIPTFPLHFFPTSSVDKTRAQVPMVDLPNPLINLKVVYIHKLIESVVKTPVRDMSKQDRISKFFRPKEESARVARRNPPARQPRKKDDAGSPVMMEPEHSRDQSEMMEVRAGKSQFQESLGIWQILLHEELLGEVQCHVGSASVKTLMKVCSASKNQAKDTRVA